MISACIIIPVYQNPLTDHEVISLKQCVKVFSNYPVVLVVPMNYNVEYLFSIINRTDNILIEKFDDSYFKSIETYNGLLMISTFYERFGEFEYALIHQLDAFVFSDDLPFWTSRGFSYVGVPWFELFDKSDASSNTGGRNTMARQYII